MHGAFKRDVVVVLKTVAVLVPFALLLQLILLLQHSFSTETSGESDAGGTCRLLSLAILDCNSGRSARL